MAITLPPDLLAQLEAEAERQNMTLPDLLTRWLNELTEKPVVAKNPLLITSATLDDMEPAIPVEDLSENFDDYLRQSWGTNTSDDQ